MDFASAQTHAMWLRANYPRAKYAVGQDPVIVSSPEEEDALGPDWFDHPSLTNRPGPRRWQDPNAPTVAVESFAEPDVAFKYKEPVVVAKSTTPHESYRSHK